jgi:CHAT domain-containing protein
MDTPLASRLELAHGASLTLKDLLDLRGTARLAVLSACESGLQGSDARDEVVSFPAGLLRAGAAGVVGSMWAVGDVSTALLMMRFYEAWIRENSSPPEALARAQGWLRDATLGSVARYLHERSAPAIAFAKFALALGDRAKARPFSHPHYWAGFHYTGV